MADDNFQINFVDETNYQIPLFNSPEEQAQKARNFQQILASGGWSIPDQATGMDKVVAWGLRAIPTARENAMFLLGRKKSNEPQEEATGMLSSLQGGFQMSNIGLIVRGDKPSITLGPDHATWYNKLAYGAGQLAGDLPTMILGGAAAGLLGLPSGPGAVAAAGAAGFAAPAAVREALMLAYDMDTVGSSGEFLNRVGIGVTHTTKEGLIGAASSLTGYGVAARMEASLASRVAAGTMTESTAKMLANLSGAAAENVVMTVTPAMLDGHLPEPSDFSNAAIIMMGMKGVHVTAEATGKLSRRLREVYARTGVRPEEQLADMNKGLVKLEELVKPEETVKLEDAATGEAGLVKVEPDLPEAYRARAAQETVQAFFEKGTPAPDTIEQMGQEMFGPRPAIEGEPPAPSQNYRTINGSDDVHAVLERWTQINLEHMQAQQGKRSFDSIAAEAEGIVAGMLDGTVQPRQPGDPVSAARLLATKGFLEGVTQDVAKAAQVLARLPENAGAELKLAVEMEFKMALSRAQLAIGELRGASSEAGRALGVMRALKQAASLADLVEGKLLEGRTFDGKPMPLKEQAALFAGLDSPEQVAKQALAANKATKFEKYAEGVVAGFMSGPLTFVANGVTNLSKLFSVPFLDVATATFTMGSKNSQVRYKEAVDRVAGNIEGVKKVVNLAVKLGREDGIGQVMRDFFLTEKYAGEYSQAPKIEGTLGSVVRTPFRALELTDLLFTTLIETGQRHVLAGRKAEAEGYIPGTREYSERQAFLAENPGAVTPAENLAAAKAQALSEGLEKGTPEFTKRVESLRKNVHTDIAKEAFDFAERELFRAKSGKIGKAVSSFISSIPLLKLKVPFVKTPLNVFKETFEMTVLSPWLSDKARADIEVGGQAAARAYTKMVVGSAMSAAVTALAMQGLISGGGDPDPNRNRAKASPGWQKYSIKIGDKWYSYNRTQPFGTLIGMTADVVEAAEYVQEKETLDKLGTMLMHAFGESVTNQTFLKGFKDMLDAFDSNTNKVSSALKSTVPGLVLPFSGLMGQTAEMLDPYKREVYTTLDAVKNRIPGVRNTLEPSIDPLGQPIPSPKRPLGVLPITVTKESEDKVRLEMGRLKNLTVAPVDKSIQLPAARQKDIGKIELTPEQRTTFATEGGKLAYQVLHDFVNSPEYDAMSDMERVMVYDAAIRAGNKMGQFKAVSMQQRLEKQLEIVKEINKRLEKKGP